ncbi:MAG: transcription antitermination factor NusB [Clostridia bacterium]|nr:transcription antitermination factor NusB [Clostridia bacterium]
MDRTSARVAAVKLVYEYLMGGEGGESTLTQLLNIEPHEDETDFMYSVVEGVKQNKAALDEELSGLLAEGWTLDRLPRVDYATLLCAAWEILYLTKSAGAAINDAVETAKQYSGEKSGAYINGVLGSLVRKSQNA